MEQAGSSGSRGGKPADSSRYSGGTCNKDQHNRKGPAPLASFDEISVISLDISSPNKAEKGITMNDGTFTCL